MGRGEARHPAQPSGTPPPASAANAAPPRHAARSRINTLEGSLSGRVTGIGNETERAQLTFHRVPYDHTAAAQAVRRSGLPEAFAQRLLQGK